MKHCLGIDVSKNDIHVCLSGIDPLQKVKVLRSGTFGNNKKGFAELVKWVGKERKGTDIPLVVVMEATGIYHENCALYLFLAGFTVSVVLPNKSKKYIAAMGIKTKNDKADAKALARMGAEQALDRWEPMGGFFYELR